MVLLISAACGRRPVGDDFEDPADYESIEIDPPQTVPLGGSATQDYVVNGVFEGKRTDVTHLCALSIDSAFGSFTDATVTVGPRGGKTAVTAGCGTVGATAQLAIT